MYCFLYSLLNDSSFFLSFPFFNVFNSIFFSHTGFFLFPLFFLFSFLCDTFTQSSTQFYPYDLPCISVCEASQRQYWHLLRLHVERLLTAMTMTTTTTTTPIHSLLQPQLLADNETLNTLTLKWPIITAEASTTEATTTTMLFSSLFLASRPFNIQYQYVLKASIPTAPSLPTTTITRNLTVNVTPDINRGQQPEIERRNEEEQQEQQQQHQQQLQKIESLQQQPDKQQHDNDNNGIDDGRLRVGEEEEEQQQQQWWNLADYNCNENFECDIMDGLMPYTTYRVRKREIYKGETEREREREKE